MFVRSSEIFELINPKKKKNLKKTKKKLKKFPSLEIEINPTKNKTRRRGRYEEESLPTVAERKVVQPST